MNNKDMLISNFRHAVAQMLSEHQNMLYERLNDVEAPSMFVQGGDLEALKEDVQESLSGIVNAIVAITEEIANLRNGEIATISEEVAGLKKTPTPKDIQLVYDGERLKEAVLTKDDGSVVKVKVGRKK